MYVCSYIYLCIYVDVYGFGPLLFITDEITDFSLWFLCLTFVTSDPLGREGIQFWIVFL